MNNFNNYHFIYQDATNTWQVAKNPVFIASHTKCKAIEKAIAPDIYKYIAKLNNPIWSTNTKRDIILAVERGYLGLGIDKVTFNDETDIATFTASHYYRPVKSKVPAFLSNAIEASQYLSIPAQHIKVKYSSYNRKGNATLDDIKAY